MNGKLAVEIIKQKFAGTDRQIRIPLQNGRSFKAAMTKEGIMVTNLGRQSLLPWIVFEVAIDLLIQKGG